ncbi:hypothetical protein QWY86_15610 [Pedobacter aquatilis]|uniref:hypothetical protein n=1 Tax=Pedobacter aquatilis TaxID=351343 RepID=UPI0025B29B58|nr:hypothetical protein [Pedobacter aquatilis]MDN3588110.1 hypothetical protein [Pedobacter aquatilis]
MNKYSFTVVFFLFGKSLLAQVNHFPSSGNVGVGIAQPLKKFEVFTPVNEVVSLGGEIGLGQFSGIHFGYLEPQNTSYRKAALIFQRTDEAARGKIHFLNNTDYTPASAGLGDARLTINHDGKIGVNNTNPAAELDVNGEIKWSGFNAGNSRAVKIGYSGGNYGGVGYNIDFSSSTGIFSRPLNDRSSYLEFTFGGFNFYGTQDASQSSNVNLGGNGRNLNLFATIIANGNMGLGIALPQEKLSVNGNIRAKEVKVEASNWPDYVFGEDYKILELTMLEQYIKTYKHLPGMPTAKESAASGVELGEMVKLLLKNQEEMTLRLIEQYKQIQELKLQLKTSDSSKAIK